MNYMYELAQQRAADLRRDARDASQARAARDAARDQRRRDKAAAAAEAAVPAIPDYAHEMFQSEGSRPERSAR
jgi:hypothetical protein